MKIKTIALRSAALTVLLAAGGCNMLDRMSQVGDEPRLTTIQNPTTTANYQPVTMPMPAPLVVERRPSSLWRPGARAFLKDQRASNVGDVVTVVINTDDSAQLDNSSDRTRTAGENAQASHFLGFESKLNKVFPDAIDPSNLVDATSDGSYNGTGNINRGEKVTVRVAATITQILPNGNLVLAGRQEMRVNYEVRDLQVAGVIRPSDITAANTIRWDQIAEARISYGGRGQISDVQQPRYGQQIFDILFPF
jgi:flagellar L-ring protein FlgH